jgi:hypothetical protein
MKGNGIEMISQERLEELKSYFWAETDEEESQEWRENLSDEEAQLINEWNEKYNIAYDKVITEIHKQINKE